MGSSYYIVTAHVCICVTFSFRRECVFTVFILCIYTAYSVYSCLSSVYCFFMGLAAWFKINDDDDSYTYFLTTVHKTTTTE